MSLRLPPLETKRLLIRDFKMSDLDGVHQILDKELPFEGEKPLERREEWLTWAIMNYRELADLNQPPYGDRAIVVRETDELVGAVGYVPFFSPWPDMKDGVPESRSKCHPVFGLYYVVSPSHQRKGYATEAAKALIDYAFNTLHLRRVVANTNYDNVASQGVMKKIGMTLHRHTNDSPEYFQILGVIDSPN